MKLKSFKHLFRWLKSYKALIVFVFLSAIISSVAKLAIPFLAGLIVNQESDTVTLLILLIAALIIGSLFRHIFEYLTALLGQKVIRDIRKDLFKSYLETSIKEIDGSRKGDLVQRLINDIENINTGLITGVATLFDGVITIIVTIIFMFSLNWILAIIAVVLIPMSLLVSRFVSNFNSKHFKSQAKASGLLSAFASESLTNSLSVETLGIKKQREEEFDLLNDEYRKSTFKANMGAALINPSTRLINAIVNAIIVMVGAILIINETSFLVGSLMSFIAYTSTFMQPFNDVSNVMSELGYASSSMERVFDGIMMKKDIDEGKEEITKEIKELTAKDVNFSYDGERKIIKDFSLDIKKGMKVAFVGPSGCGKTTIINLLMRFYDPQDGEFYIDGVSTKDIAKKSLREHVGMVLQDTWIFEGTVFENIAYAKPHATIEEVKNAAKKAQATGFIERLPKGYDTRISDSSGLSVGEKQLICVARVMLLEPEIVILDEATSNIDIRTEKLLNESFKSLFEGRTSLVVAHRLSTIISSDLIVCLKDGAIMEKGSHQELIAKKGFYYELFNAQFK